MGAGAAVSHSGKEVTLIDAAGPWSLAYTSTTGVAGASVLAPRTDAFPTIHTDTIYADVLGTTDAPNMVQSAAATGRIVFQRQTGRFQLLRLLYSGADNCQADHRLWGLLQISLGGAAIQYTWVPIATFTGTAGTKTGVSGGLVTSTMRYVDTQSSIVDCGFNVAEIKRPTVDQGSVALRWESRDFAWFVLESSTNTPATKATGVNGLIRGFNGGGV